MNPINLFNKTVIIMTLLMLLISKNGNCQNAYITSVLINSCNGSCLEGDNEVIFGNTGGGSLLATPTNMQVNYGSTPAPTATYTDVFTTNPTTTAALNTAAGCSLFIDAAGTTIPANQPFIIVRNTICTNALIWSTLCSSAPIYIIYSTDATWASGGNFGNGTGATRYFTSIFNNSLGSSTVQYNYTLPAIYSNDGAYANWSNTGGAANFYGDNDCSVSLSNIALPVELLQFSGNTEGNGKIELTWETASEIRIDHFEIQHASENAEFKSIGTIAAKGSEHQGANYQLSFDKLVPGINYFSLVIYNAAYQREESKIISVAYNPQTMIYNSEKKLLTSSEDALIQVISTEGRLMRELVGNTSYDLSDLKGYFILFSSLDEKRLKIIVD